MVEKSEKKPFCDAKYGKNWVFLGDGLLGPKRGTSNINDLRAPQAAPDRPTCMAEHEPWTVEWP
jgi:hypothetical protein